MNRAIAVVHNAVRDSSLPDEQDVLIQVEAVSNALMALGYKPVPLPCDLDLEDLKSRLIVLDPFVAFNLVESIDGHGRLIHLVPTLLDAMRIPYTGCSAEAILATSHKVMAKERMKAGGIPTPDWINPVPQDMPWTGATDSEDPDKKLWIIKSLWEHASLGLEKENLVQGTAGEIHKLLSGCKPDMGGTCFAESFIEGREFNLSLLDMETGVRILPPAEILFEGLDADMPRIVGYKAKWIQDSVEYHNTPRCFDFPDADKGLLSVLENLALKCWYRFGLKGYARVDFRVDDCGQPFVLEINANPCISPDAGFAAALERAHITYTHAVEQILIHRSQPAMLNKKS
ncbi:MAG: D-alanine--D-alanine ligase [Desulfobacula sp.]